MADPLHTKTCKACGAVKMDDKFPKVVRAKDGRGGTCYACRWATRAAAGHTDQQQECARKRVQRWKRRNPTRAAAHNAVWRAVRSGKLTRGSCAVCGSAEAEAHHADYGAPLDVQWLCKGHHEELHVRADRQAA